MTPLGVAAAAAAALGVLGGVAYAVLVAATPAVAMMSAALAFGILGALVAARRMYFLAGAVPHSALLAAVAAVPAAFSLGVDPALAAAVLGVALVYAIGYYVHRGADPDTAASLFVSVTASLSVVLVYVVLSRYPLGFDVSALVFGDPLLATRGEALQAAVAAAMVAAAGLLTYREQVYIGTSREHALLAGLRLWLYDLVFFTLLGAALSLLIRVAGFVLEHVLVLVPGAVASRAPSAGEALLYALGSSLSAAALGLWIGFALNASPAGVTGLVLFVLYAMAVVAQRGAAKG